MIYDYYSRHQERGRKPEPIDDFIKNIEKLLNEKKFGVAELEIKKLIRRLERQTIKNPELLEETLSKVDDLLQETFNQLIQRQNFELAADFLRIFGKFFTTEKKEGKLIIPEDLSSNETFKAAVRDYILSFLDNRNQFEWLINNFQRLGLINRSELIKSPETKKRAIEILVDYLDEIEITIETVVEEVKTIEKSIFFEKKQASIEEIRELEAKIEQGGIEQAITNKADLNVLREEALRRISRDNIYFRELLNLKNRFFSKINSFVDLGIFNDSSEAINHPTIKGKISETFRKYQDRFSNNRREIELRIWLWKRERNLSLESLND